MTETLWIVGGEQRGVPHWTREWKLFKKALVVKVEHGSIQRVLEYESPPEHCPDELHSIVFKSGSIRGDCAYLCTQTEVLVCKFPSFAIQRVISHPCFNDLHHVTLAPDGRLFVAVTGLDAVAELAPDGALLRLTSVIDDSVWDRFSETVDYRKVATTKPHRAHPNFVFFLDGRVWVTRFQQRDAVPLDRCSKGRSPFDIAAEGAHDGHVMGDIIYFTTVNGLIVRFDLKSGTRKVFDLNAARDVDPDRPLGWCRGLLPTADRAWVGFSRIRYTALRTNLDWVRHGFQRADRYPPCPTRVALYDLAKLALLEEVDLEDAGMNAVFSIHGASPCKGAGSA